jgi:hypothetical protein
VQKHVCNLVLRGTTVLVPLFFSTTFSRELCEGVRLHMHTCAQKQVVEKHTFATGCAARILKFVQTLKSEI